MLGAIIGDMVGAPYEFNPIKTKDFELFTDESTYTDDTILTVAVAEALLTVGDIPDPDPSRLSAIIGYNLRKWARRYPNPKGGYGNMFNAWINSNDPEPYNSYGNGAPARVSPAGWIYDEGKVTRRVAFLTAGVTHNHPEAIDATEAVALAIYEARKGYGKDRIAEYIEDIYDYDISTDLDVIRLSYNFTERAKDTVPQAIRCYLESTSFEDAIRNAVSLGGDADTLAAIAGSIAEAEYGIPDDIKQEAMKRLPSDMQEVVKAFYAYIGADR